jgi:hypothetical protein
MRQLRARWPDGLARYQAEHNERSIDGLSAVEQRVAPSTTGQRFRAWAVLYRSAAGQAIR